jgi:hypothetical protein
MTENKDVLKQRAQMILDEITREKTDHGFSYPAGGMVSSLTEHVTDNDRDLLKGNYIIRYIFDTAMTITTKSWEKTSDIMNLLPPYGFRKEEEIPQWAYWFTSHKKRTLSVNRFLHEIQGTDIKQSVFDMMFETVRYEQTTIALRMIQYLSDEDNWG